MTGVSPPDGFDGDQAHYVLEMWRETSRRRSERRSYEWKIAFGVWGGLLLAINAIASHATDLQEALDDANPAGVWVVTVALAILVLAHLAYLIGIALGYGHDLDDAITSENALRKLCGLHEASGPTGASRPIIWVTIFEAAVTLSLAAVLWVITAGVLP